MSIPAQTLDPEHDTFPKLIRAKDIKEFYRGLTGVGQLKSCRDVRHYHRRKPWLS